MWSFRAASTPDINPSARTLTAAGCFHQAESAVSPADFGGGRERLFARVTPILR